MYIFDKEPTYYSKPWPHIVIDDVLPADVADHIKDNFPSCNEHDARGPCLAADYTSDPVFTKFHESIHSNADRMNAKMDEIFKSEYDGPYSMRHALYRDQPPTETFSLIRDWHIDAPNKKHKFMFYFDEGEGGWFELINPITKEEKRYEYKHNRLIAFQNTLLTAHRFYTSDKLRKTIAIGTGYAEDKQCFNPAAAQHVIELI